MDDEVKIFRRDVLLKNYTTFGIGGPAKFFFEAKNTEEIKTAVEIAKDRDIPYFVIGGGSNILVADEGYNGLVIKIKDLGLRIKGSKIYAQAGVPLNQLVNLAAEKNLAGLEWAAGIPGTVGGAICGNAGAFGMSMADVVERVRVMDCGDLSFKIYNLKECRFDYRNSIFKSNKKLIILSCVIRLINDPKQGIKARMERFLAQRKESQPLGLASAGSVFKNPVHFSAGRLIEKCSLKGAKVGQAQISEKHANFIVNLGRATAEDVLALINLAKKKVEQKFGIKLKEEIQYLGVDEEKKR